MSHCTCWSGWREVHGVSKRRERTWLQRKEGESQPSDRTPRLPDTGGEDGGAKTHCIRPALLSARDCKLTCIRGSAAWGTKPGSLAEDAGMWSAVD